MTLDSDRGRRQPGDRAAAPVRPDILYRQDAASYVAAMLAELRRIAGKAGFDKLASAVDAAYYEAYGLIEPQGRASPAIAGEETSPGMEPPAA